MIYDRETTVISEELVYNSKATTLLYNTFVGGCILHLLRRPIFSKLYGFMQKTTKSAKRIEQLVQTYNIDISGCEKPQISMYNSFNDFITRRLRGDCLHIDNNLKTMISPAYSCVLGFRINENSLYTVKGKRYTLDKLIGSAELASQYAGGMCLIFRLAVADYHRFCFIDNGKLLNTTVIKGGLDSINMQATGKFTLATNYRKVSTLCTENFGDMIFVEVGAMLVGKIVATHTDLVFKKGEEKGYFEFGGSTIVIITKPGSVKIDADILKYSEQGIETRVKLGERIGVRADA